MSSPGIDLLKALLSFSSEEESDKRGLQVGGPPAHEDPACGCNQCRLSRFELPGPLEGDEAADAIVDAFKEVHEICNNSIKAGQGTTVELVLQPLPPDVERTILQFRIDRLNVCARAEQALVALMPEDRRPPDDMVHKEITMEYAMRALEETRTKTIEKLEQCKAEAEVRRAAREAAAAVGAPPAKSVQPKPPPTDEGDLSILPVPEAAVRAAKATQTTPAAE